MGHRETGESHEAWPVSETKIIERSAEQAVKLLDRRIPRWALVTLSMFLLSIVVGAVLTTDQLRQAAIEKACSGRFETILAATNNRFLIIDSRLAEGERIRAERTKQLDEHETQIRVTKDRLDVVIHGLKETFDSFRAQLVRLEDKIDKLKDRP